MFAIQTIILIFFTFQKSSGVERQQRLLDNDPSYQIHQIQIELQNLRASISQKDDQIRVLTDRVTHLETASSPTPVGFYATLTTHTTLGQLQTVDFDTTVTDYTASYNNITGVFTVPESGLYHFSTTMFSPSGPVHTELMKNQKVVGNNYGFSSGASGTINTIVNCQKGDVVYVRHMNGLPQETIYGVAYSAFSGFRIK